VTEDAGDFALAGGNASENSELRLKRVSLRDPAAPQQHFARLSPPLPDLGKIAKQISG
jgi:hypothetical protein